MLVITHIEAEEIPDIKVEIYSRLAMHGVLEETETAVATEVIYGVRFKRPDGSTINIGTSKQAQEVIGIQYEAWKNLEKELHRAGSELNSLRKEKKFFQDMGFWSRLRWALK